MEQQEVAVGAVCAAPSDDLACPNCGQRMLPEHAHHKCPGCGYIEPCCGW